ncbi:hypothetical protein [Microvirga sp. 2YAF29]|uniref:hypothetical protein n=1 Tax=Microvirga sp. 2YAF29 TaxID=3233031 RepID=UPI003F968D83
MMTHTKPNTSAEQLDRALDRMAEDIEATSDQDILREAVEAYGSVKTAVDRVQGALNAALKRSGRKKFEAARAGLRATREARAGATVIALSFAEKRGILDRFAGKNNPVREKLTMAARNGIPLGESEIDGMIEDLIEIGAIDEKGNPL